MENVCFTIDKGKRTGRFTLSVRMWPIVLYKLLLFWRKILCNSLITKTVFVAKGYKVHPTKMILEKFKRKQNRTNFIQNIMVLLED